MNEFKPCPICGGHGSQTDYLVSVGCIQCDDCGFEVAVGAWDTLSDMAALWRAVERLETLAPHRSGRTIECYATHAAVLDWQASHMQVDAAVVCEVDGAHTLAAALIALAERIEETP